MDRRLKLDAELREILQEALGYVHLYFQPPASVQMKYDCIRYEEQTMKPQYADNKVYAAHTQYRVTVISRDPDCEIPRMLLERFQYCMPDRKYVADNLYHYPFTIYY